MTNLLEIPELQGLHSRQSVVRIPDQIDIPLTDRVRNIIDAPEFRRLTRISQLGLVSMVYPAAHHSRMEHSLGVYRMTLLFLEQLSYDERFAKIISVEDAELLIAASLLHDLGHWPFCHPIEDLRLPEVPEHELFANSFLLEGEVADCLREDWGINPRDVVSLLSEKARSTKKRILQSILSGPIDVDKMDYLQRDSLHAGVPYGRNFDQQRLIGSLCLNEAGTGLALSDKGRTAAEMMVFARYVMFSEVYWHHTVRAATAMLQRAFFMLYQQLDLDSLFRMTEQPMIDAMITAAGKGPASDLLLGLFGPSRRLYKQLLEFSFSQHEDIYDMISRRPYPWLVQLAEEFANRLSKVLARRVAPHEILIDAPPVKLEVQFNIEIYDSKRDVYRNLGDVSPMVKTLATKQFDDFVKKVRAFAHPSIAQDLRDSDQLESTLMDALEALE